MCTAMRELIRKAGQRLNQMDSAYAQAIQDRFKLTEDPSTVKSLQGLTSAVPISEIINNPYQPDRSQMTRNERIMDMGMDAAVLTSNIAARYALPAGGVTLAGVGLYETGKALMGNQQTEGTITLI